MNQDKETVFVGQVRQRLEEHAQNLDEQTLARLAAARRAALAQTDTRSSRRYAMGGLAAAAAVLLAVLLVQQGRPPDSVWNELVVSGDIELIEDLEFYAWLEATQPNS